MKLVTIVPGFGGAFYCGNCLRDSFFMKALNELKHEASVIPIYLPLNLSENYKDNKTPIFYGAVSIYLKQNYRIFRNLPKWLEKIANSSPVLSYAAKKAGSSSAKGLEEMTISMLRGHEGYQKEELQQLVDFLKYNEKPDIVHLSNALLLGLAQKIKEEVGCAVVCSLQDEDVWIEAMHQKYIPQLWKLLSEKAKDVDAFIAVSQYFAEVMQTKMNIPSEKLYISHIGINTELYSYNKPAQNPMAIGYLSRLNDENGFELLIDAFILLKKNPQFSNLKLIATGGYTSNDLKFLNKQKKKLKESGFLNDIEVIENYTSSILPEFFSQISILSVPVLKGEAFGLYQLEALASGIPLVQPNLGAFPEIAKLTGGSYIYKPNTPEALAKALEKILSDSEMLKEMSQKGRGEVLAKFNVRKLSEEMCTIYEEILNKKTSLNKTKFHKI